MWGYQRNEILDKINPIVFAFVYWFLAPNPSEYTLVVSIRCAGQSFDLLMLKKKST
jgi:hypothetical protein